uniref:Cyclin-dependent kinase inhibitor n=2 Tax=Bursaphelenchus xylophilus TaxID=6326 RepID=A0A1I7SFR5_BURXY
MICSSTSSTPDSSASTSPVSAEPHRRRSKRISIRNLDESAANPPESSPSFSRLTPDDPIKRHVHFGFCEEIQYGSDEEEDEAAQNKPSGHMTLRKANSLPAEGTTPLVGVLRHRNDSQISVQKSKMASVFKWVRLCAPKN